MECFVGGVNGRWFLGDRESRGRRFFGLAFRDLKALSIKPSGVEVLVQI
jgi:hypothetical protein